jgi:hypothetical protein
MHRAQANQRAGQSSLPPAGAWRFFFFIFLKNKNFKNICPF